MIACVCGGTVEAAITTAIPVVVWFTCMIRCLGRKQKQTEKNDGPE